MNLLRTIRTVRHLRAGQILAQIEHRSNPPWWDAARAAAWPTPPFPGIAWKPHRLFLPARQPDCDAAAGEFRFLDDRRMLGFPPDWHAPGAPKLWQYHLHYFDYLWWLDFDQARSIITDWIDRYPPNAVHAGWDPYPTSLRLVNWCAVAFGLFREQTQADPALAELFWSTIHRQAEWLRRRIEWHLLGNHVLENAAALVIAGSCFHGAAAQQWYRQGLDILRQQLPEQFLPDGGHVERSPMYQLRLLYVLSLLRDIGREELSDLVEPYLGYATAATACMCHPDGDIALLNDSALAVYHRPEELLAHLGRAELAPSGPFALPETGYYGARTVDGSYVICDAGPIGPDYQPGHGHGDALSFELSLRGQRVIVDSGVCSYAPSPLRDYCRSTAAHNTIEIDAQDQCEFWGAFRVGSRARVRIVNWMTRDDGFELSAEHDGYERLSCHARHERRFRWFSDGRLWIDDRVTSRKPALLASRLHLHPQCALEALSARLARVGLPSDECQIEFTGPGRLSIEDSRYCPQFGRVVQNRALVWRSQCAGQSQIGIRIHAWRRR